MTDSFASPICRPASLMLSIMLGPMLYSAVADQSTRTLASSPSELYTYSLLQLLAETGVVSQDIGTNLSTALAFPPWTAEVFTLVGLILLVLGVMAWFSSPGQERQIWGLRLVMSGLCLAIVGFGFQAFVDVLRYILAG